MIEYFLAPGSIPFTAALLVMAGLLAFEIVALLGGLGLNELVDDLVVSNVDLPDDLGGFGDPGDAQLSTGIDGSASPEGVGMLGRLLAWLYVGKVPVLMVLVIFLTVFGLAGLIGQSLLRQGFGAALPGVVAAPAVFFLSLPFVRWCAGGLARIMPREETSAVSPRSFLGRTAVIVGGNARQGLAAQARLTDQFGTTHYVLVEPEDAGTELDQGALVLLVRRVDGRFTAIPNPSEALENGD